MKKKIISFILTATLLTITAGCGNTDTQGGGQTVSTQSAAESSIADTQAEAVTERDNEQSVTQAAGTTEAAETASNILVAYFSWADNAVIDGDVDAVSSPSVTAPGNVQELAGWVQEETGGDLFSIRVTDPYPSDWDQCLDRANEERGEDARPQLQENVENLGSYDTVFLGYPNWWYGVPMALLSFLEENDLSGKQVYLFCSHGTGGLAGSVEQIAEAAPGAVISDNIFDCYEEEAASSEEAVKAWIDELGSGSQTQEETDMPGKQISVQFGDAEVIYELNGSIAADALYEMLPLTVNAEDFSTNEKIFYPPEALACAETPLASSGTGAGTLAYYEPWGDVVMFYDNFNENPSLYELGHAVSGAEQIRGMSGTITVEAIE